MIVVPPIMVLLAKSPQFNKYDLSSIKGKNLIIFKSESSWNKYFSQIFRVELLH